MALHQRRNRRQSDEAQIVLELSDPARLPDLVDFLVKHQVQGAIVAEDGVTRILIDPIHAAVIADHLRPWWGSAPGLTITGI